MTYLYQYTITFYCTRIFMQLSKYITTALLSILALGAGYLIIGQTHPSTSDGVNISTGSVNISQSGIETDTGARLMTLAQSGTQWGISPFGSGKPLTEEKKPEFKKPNTEWKSRSVTLSDGRTLYYEFGKGNPSGVSLDKTQIAAMTKTCENNVGLAEKGICNVELGFMYITPEVEKHLLLALSDPNWSKLATVCEKNFLTRETHLTQEVKIQMITGDTNFLYFDRVFAPGFLDLDRFISVEPTTGFKVLNNNLVISLAKFVMNAMYDGALRGESQPNPYGDCVDKYGKDIALHLVAATNLYARPLEPTD
jgi:hypothetical protein